MSVFDLLELIYAQIIFLFRLFHSQFNSNSVNLSDFNQNSWAKKCYAIHFCLKFNSATYFQQKSPEIGSNKIKPVVEIMSSKNVNKKSDDKIFKAEQEALKEPEIVAELAPNEKIRKEAEELIETVETQSNSIAQDSSETKDTCKQSVLKFTEAISKFQPKYAEAISKLQEEYIQLIKLLR